MQIHEPPSQLAILRYRSSREMQDNKNGHEQSPGWDPGG